MADMKEMAARYRNGKGSGTAKKEKKNLKKQFNIAMKQSMDRAENGEIAVILHNGKQYILMQADKIQEAVNNVQATGKFQLKLPEDLKQFQELHQEVLAIMSKIDYEELGRDQFDSDEDFALHQKIVKRNSDLFDNIDQFTFKFSGGFGKNKAARKEIVDDYEAFKSKHPEIKEILRGQVKHVV